MRRIETKPPSGIEIRVPGSPLLTLRHAVFDFNGTLACDGALRPGVAVRLRRLAKLLPLTVLTADTFGTAAAVLRRLPVTVHTIRTGRDKAAFVARFHSAGVVAIGNGNNDVSMLRGATLSIAVIGREGLSPAALAAASLVAPDVNAAIEILLEPKRVAATLRR